MKYIKTFERFSPINEAILGFDLEKIKQAIKAVSSEVEKNVIPNMDDYKKAKIAELASNFAKKAGIKNEDDLITKAMGETQEHQEEVEDVAQEVGITESMINEELGERTARFFKRLGTYAGIGTMLFGLTSFASNISGYIDFSIMTKLHDLTQSILGPHAGPLGLLILLLGILLAFMSQIWGYNRGV